MVGAGWALTHSPWLACLSSVARAAWEFAQGMGKKCPFTLVSMNPTLVIGPMIQPGLNTSSKILRTMAQTGGPDTRCVVDVRYVSSPIVLLLLLPPPVTHDRRCDQRCRTRSHPGRGEPKGIWTLLVDLGLLCQGHLPEDVLEGPAQGSTAGGCRRGSWRS